MVSLLGLALFIERETEPFLKVRSTETVIFTVSRLRLSKNFKLILSINGFSPDGLTINYFNELFEQTTEGVTRFLNELYQ
jgi:hypothetical protein